MADAIQTIVIQRNTSTGEKKGFPVEVIEQYPDFSAAVRCEAVIVPGFGFEFYAWRTNPAYPEKRELNVIDVFPIQEREKPYTYKIVPVRRVPEDQIEKVMGA